MLEVDLHWETSSGISGASMSVANIGTGPVTRYAVKVGDEKEADAASLLDYARWSEPLGGLIARCLALRRESVESGSLSEPIRRLGCKTALVSYGVGPKRLLEDFTVERCNEFYSARLIDAYGKQQRREFAAVNQSPVALFVEAVCQVLWRVSELPPLPPPLNLPIYNNGAAYVRVADIPPWAFPAFDRFARGRRCPTIAGDSDPCVYARDWRAFLG